MIKIPIRKLTEKIKKRNELRLQIIRQLKNKPRTRTELVKILNKPRTTIYDNLEALLNSKIIKKERILKETRGRPEILWSIY